LHRHQYAWVATHAGPALQSRHTGRRAALFKATSLLALGEFKEARFFLADLAPQQRPDPATYHFLSAHAAGGLGQHDVAARELQACLELEPSYRQDAEALDTLKEALRAVGGVTHRSSRDAYS
jgi:tetratricopeptide (TPR) repeat protein